MLVASVSPTTRVASAQATTTAPAAARQVQTSPTSGSVRDAVRSLNVLTAARNEDVASNYTKVLKRN